MLCGTMTRNVQDLDFLHHREGVNVFLNVSPDHWPVLVLQDIVDDWASHMQPGSPTH